MAEGVALEERLQLAGEVFPVELSHIAIMLRIPKVNVCLFSGVGLCE